MKGLRKIIAFLVFSFSILVVLINCIPLIFPALIAKSLIKSDDTVSPFELGVWSIPLIVVNLVILIFSILYFKNLIPRSVQNSIKFILTFEVSKRICKKLERGYHKREKTRDSSNWQDSKKPD